MYNCVHKCTIMFNNVWYRTVMYNKVQINMQRCIVMYNYVYWCAIMFSKVQYITIKSRHTCALYSIIMYRKLRITLHIILYCIGLYIAIKYCTMKCNILLYLKRITKVLSIIWYCAIQCYIAKYNTVFYNTTQYNTVH